MEFTQNDLIRAVIMSDADRAAALLKAATDPYDKAGLKLADLLLRQWNKQTREAINDAVRYLTRGEKDGTITKKDIKKVLNRLDVKLGTHLVAGVDQGVQDILTGTYSLAQSEEILTVPTFNLIDEKAVTWLHENHLYWIGNHYSSHIQQDIKAVADKVIKDGLSRKDASKEFKDKFSDKFKKSAYYWEGLSNHAVTRAREFGRTQGYVVAEVEELEIVAVMDNRTTPICQYMNGKVIKVSQAVKLRDKIISAKDPEAVKKIDKWYSVEQVKKKKKLPLSMSLPPYHFGCRTRTVRH